MKARHLPITVLAAIAWAFWAWNALTTSPARPVTDIEARGFLERIVAAARAKDFEGLCGLSSAVSRCKGDLEAGGCPVHLEEFSEADVKVVCGRFVPDEPPVVVSTRPVPEEDGSSDGRIVVVRGENVRGEPYETEVYVFWTGRDFAAINAVYWSGHWIAESSGGERDLTRVKPVPAGS